MEFDKTAFPFTKFGTTKDNRLHFRDKKQSMLPIPIFN